MPMFDFLILVLIFAVELKLSWMIGAGRIVEVQVIVVRQMQPTVPQPMKPLGVTDTTAKTAKTVPANVREKKRQK